MNVPHSSFVLLGLVLAGGTVALVFPSRGHAVQGQGGNPNNVAGPARPVIVENTAAQPVPVTGAVEVDGSVAIAGVATVQGDVDAQQSGTWTVGIDPTRNTVSLAGATPFGFDSTFGIVNDGATIDFGPFDTSAVRSLRILARAVNGDVSFTLLSPNTFGGLVLDEFVLFGESGNRYESILYDTPPTSVIVRVHEAGGPGGANYHFVLVGR